MSSTIINKLENGMLTERMDLDSSEYNDFKLLIKSKSLNTNKSDRIKIGLLGLKFEMEDYLESRSKSKEVGFFIKNFLKTIEVRQNEFAKYVEIRPSNLSKILNGERRLSLEMALILEKLSNIDAELWLRIQYKNEINIVKKENRLVLNKFKLKQLIS